MIEIGAKVIDKDGTVLGTVDHLVNNLTTGSLTSFLVRREDEDLFITPEEVKASSENEVVLKVDIAELVSK